MSFDFNTLVTDRTQQDVAYAKYLAEKLVAGTATEAEKAEWNSFALKGVYNHTDLNRVTVAMDILKAKMESYGYAVPNYKKIEIPYPSTGGGSILPVGYTELAWIESTGTQYIDTGFMHNQDTRVVMDVQATSMTANAWAFGGRITNSNARHDVFYYHTNSTWASDYHSSRKSPEGIGATDRVLIDFDKNVCTINGVTVTHEATTFQSTANLMLLALNTAGTISGQMSAKLYSCQIYDNGTLIRDYIPCKNNAGMVGLYDIVNKTFYQNAGSGSFLAGATYRDLPYEYTQVEYIESDGAQYINSGVNGKSGLEVHATWMYTNDSYKRAIIGCLGNDLRTYPMHHSASNYGYAYQSWVASNLVMTVNTLYNLYTKLYSGAQIVRVNGEVITTGSKTGDYDCGCPMYIFALYNDGSPSNYSVARLYGMQIYDHGTLVRDFVPCINSANVAGLYDMVSGVFYQNAGTGTFTVGNSITSATQSSSGSTLNSGKVTLRNLVADGSFETTNTWSTWSTDALVTEQAYLGATSLKLTGDQLAQVPVELPILNHVYYAREYIKTDGDVTIGDGRFEVHGGDGVGLNWVYGWNRGNYPGWTIQSGVHKIEAVNASSYVLRTFKVGGSGTAYVDGIMLIDLTAAFGSGFEPDKEWCDTHIPFFAGSKVLTLPPRYNWQEYDIPTVHQLSVYLTNVAIIRSVLAVMETTPDVPVSMLNFMFKEANDVEQILLDVSRQLSTMATTFIPCGEALCGGDNL